MLRRDVAGDERIGLGDWGGRTGVYKMRQAMEGVRLDKSNGNGRRYTFVGHHIRAGRAYMLSAHCHTPPDIL